MRIQLLPESHMFHGHAIPPGIPLRGEMPACQKEKNLVGMGTDLISILELFLQHHWQRHSEVRSTCSSRTGLWGPVGWWGKEGFLSREVWGEKKPQPTTGDTNPKQNPKGSNKQTERPPARAAQKVTEAPGRSGHRDTCGSSLQLFQGSFHDQAFRVLLSNTNFWRLVQTHLPPSWNLYPGTC